MSNPNLEPGLSERLKNVSRLLLQLHKALLDEERAIYEAAQGTILSPNEFLGLVLNHQQFAWLRKLSGLIVEIDEITAPRSKAGAIEAESALHQTRTLMTLEEPAGAFQLSLKRILARSKQVAVAHSQVLRELELP